jgi:hypothetical protein
MNRVIVHLAAILVRGWTRAYTSGLPEPLGTERRLEIESDTWELEGDPDGGRGLGVAGQMLGRLLIGVPHDLLWRFEHAADDVAARRVAATVIVLALFLAALWTGGGALFDARPMAAARVADCVNTAEPPHSRAELRIRIMDCTGAFFTPDRNVEAVRSRR